VFTSPLSSNTTLFAACFSFSALLLTHAALPRELAPADARSIVGSASLGLFRPQCNDFAANIIESALLAALAIDPSPWGETRWASLENSLSLAWLDIS